MYLIAETSFRLVQGGGSVYLSFLFLCSIQEWMEYKESWSNDQVGGISVKSGVKQPIGGRYQAACNTKVCEVCF